MAQNGGEGSATNRFIPVVGISIVLAVLLVILGIVVSQKKDQEQEASQESLPPESVSDIALPKGADKEYEYGLVVSGSKKSPRLDIFEDFQCPGCSQMELTVGHLIQRAAENNDVRVIFHPMIFLDKNLGGDSSLRATNAFGCAADADKALFYHNILFASQPKEEGAGWTDEQLKGFGREIGISGTKYDEFSRCIDEGTYKDWARLTNDMAAKIGVTRTPTVFFNLDELDDNEKFSPEEFQKILTSENS